jgi:Uma2 family endonuclease
MTTPASAPRPATRADLEALPEHIVGEIIDGVLYTFPRPRPQHGFVETMVATGLGVFQHGRGAVGGWWIIVEPGLALEGSPEVVPELAGWRRERLPVPPQRDSIQVVPDWVCEILSPSTRGHDQLIKRRFYARVGVSYLWFIDPDTQTLSVCTLREGQWLEVGVYGRDERIRPEPFEAVEFNLADWWLPESPATTTD